MLPVKFVFFGKLYRAFVAVFFLEIVHKVFRRRIFTDFQADLVNYIGIFMRTYRERGTKIIVAALLRNLSRFL